MLRSHLKIVLRNFGKYPAFSLINLGGLSIGIAASFVLLVYTQREMSCDTHFKDSDKIVRIGTDFFNMGPFAVTQPMLGPLLKTSCKDAQSVTSMSRDNEEVPVRLSTQERAFTGIYPYYIDAGFFQVFSYEAIRGSLPTNGLAPGETIISESLARKFFNREDPIGKTLLVDKENKPFKVVAVLKESFAKSHLAPSLLLPLSPEATAPKTLNWKSASLYTYVKLKTDPSGHLNGAKAVAKAQAGLRQWLDRLRERAIYPADNSTMTFAQWKESIYAVKFIIQPLQDIYFQSNLKFDLSPGGNPTQVKLLGAISIFLILLAIINYINLVTARSSIRSREIGVKKTFGAPRRSLIGQFLLESLLFSFLAALIACGLIQVILFGYQTAAGIPLTGPMPLLSAHYGYLVLFSLLVGLLAGLYPAFYLTAFKPLLSIRYLVPAGKGNSGIRNSLVLVQFIVATALIFASFVVYAQLQYIKNKDKGFTTEGVVLVENTDLLGNGADAFRQLVEQQSPVVSTSFCNRTPGSNSIWMHSYRTPAMTQDLTLQTFPVDDRYLSTLGMHLTDGRNFSRNLITDTNSLILNESAVAALGLFHPIGTTINGSEKIIGVVKDFNFASFREKISPVVLRYVPSGNTLAIKVKGGHLAAFLEQLDQLGKKFLPDGALHTRFLDDNFSRLAEKEKLLGKAITFFAALAIVLATLGLIGLTLFTIERRTREIGIRKVLGAGMRDILGLISGDFIRLAAVASLLAFPLSWWLVHRWLQDYAYRVSISPGTFLLTESIILAIVFLVIGVLGLRTAMADPAASLRSE